MNKLYHKLTSDLGTHSALHFIFIKEALNSTLKLSEIIQANTNGIMNRINNAIIFQNDINDGILINECLQVVFGLYESRPTIGFKHLKGRFFI